MKEEMTKSQIKRVSAEMGRYCGTASDLRILELERERDRLATERHDLLGDLGAIGLNLELVQRGLISEALFRAEVKAVIERRRKLQEGGSSVPPMAISGR